jgi:hypothetical protein
MNIYIITLISLLIVGCDPDLNNSTIKKENEDDVEYIGIKILDTESGVHINTGDFGDGNKFNEKQYTINSFGEKRAKVRGGQIISFKGMTFPKPEFIDTIVDDGLWKDRFLWEWDFWKNKDVCESSGSTNNSWEKKEKNTETLNEINVSFSCPDDGGCWRVNLNAVRNINKNKLESIGLPEGGYMPYGGQSINKKIMGVSFEVICGD